MHYTVVYVQHTLTFHDKNYTITSPKGDILYFIKKRIFMQFQEKKSSEFRESSAEFGNSENLKDKL